MHERGSILIVALWAASLFAIFAATLALGTGQEILLMKREVADLKHREDFASALHWTVGLIQEDTEPHEDSRNKAWYGELNSEEIFNGRLHIHVDDEESKINLNTASAALLDAFFKRYEDEIGPLKGSRKEYAKAISKLKYEKKIESLEELLLIDEFQKEDLASLRPYLTVYTQNALINPNTASPIVLKALIDSLSSDHGSKQILISRLEEACGSKGCLFRADELSPPAFMERLRLPTTPLMTQVVQAFLVSLTLDSETFHISIKTQDRAEAEAVFSCRVGQTRPEVWWWHE